MAQIKGLTLIRRGDARAYGSGWIMAVSGVRTGVRFACAGAVGLRLLPALPQVGG